MAVWHNGIIEKIIDEAPTTKRFWLRVQRDEALRFRAGQFVVMDLPISEKRLHRWRSYSIANAPNDDNLLEFCVARFDGGLGTGYLFEQATIGTNIRFKEPSGIFTLPSDVSARHLVMVCTGTGIAPFRSMIHHLRNTRAAYGSIHLIFGTRHRSGILYEAEFRDFAQNMPNFRYSVALSREAALPQGGNGNDFHKGYVHPIYEQAYGRPDVARHFYLCGWQNMLDEASARLEKMGYEKGQIHMELYG
jgi:ferredoxin-NADP reductase